MNKMSNSNKLKKNGAASAEVAPKIQPTAEQIQLAQLIATRHTDNELQSQVKQIMEFTCKSQDAVVIALHDHADTNEAIDYLLEEKSPEVKWEVSTKKKKRQPQPPVAATSTAPPPPATEKAPETNGAASATTNGPESRSEGEEKKTQPSDRGRDQPFRRRGGPRTRAPPRMNRGGANNSHNWRIKESEKNQRNLEDHGPQNGAPTADSNATPSPSNGTPPLPTTGTHRGDNAGRGGFGGPKNNRGRGGDRNGEGRYRGGGRGRGRSRGRSRTFQNRSIGGGNPFTPSIETWNQNEKECTLNVGNWSEFVANEELSEEDWNGTLTETKVFTPSSKATQQSMDSINKSNSTSISSSLATTNCLPTVEEASQSLPSMPNTSHMGPNKFAMTEYAQQAAETIKAAVGIPSRLANVTTSKPSLPNVGSSLPNRSAYNSSKQAKKNPSKIPESAVEMPELGSLDFQFGALEFGSNDTILDSVFKRSPMKTPLTLPEKSPSPLSLTPEKDIPASPKENCHLEQQATFNKSPKSSSSTESYASPKSVPPAMTVSSSSNLSGNTAPFIHQTNPAFVSKPSSYNSLPIYSQTSTAYNPTISNAYSSNLMTNSTISTKVSQNSSSLLDSDASQHQITSNHTYDATPTAASSTVAASSYSTTPNYSVVTNSFANVSSPNPGATSSSTNTTSVIKPLPATGKTGPTNIQAAGPPILNHTQYLVGQPGVSFYGIPPNIYNIEEMQILQSRMQPMSYYDMQYQAQAAGRDPNIAYSGEFVSDHCEHLQGLSSLPLGSEGRYSRSEADAIATSLAQPNSNQTQAFMNAASSLPPGYTYYYPGNVMPTYPTMYPVPPGGHGSTAATQFPKPATYGSYNPDY